jgi:hypothetical protein
MPLIGDVDKYMAGGTTVAALYAGAVKVWPLAPAAADRTATWRPEAPNVLHLVIDGGTDFPPVDSVFTVAVAAYTGGTLTHPEYPLGVSVPGRDSEINWRHSQFGEITMTVAGTAFNGQKVTNGIAVQEFAGRTLRLTTAASARVTLIELVA